MTDDRAEPLKIGIVIDEFVGLAGAADFLLSVIDGLARAEPGWSVIFINRQPPARWSRTAANLAVRRFVKAALKGRRPTGRPVAFDPAPFMARARRNDRPTSPLIEIAHGSKALETFCSNHRVDAILPLAIALPKGFVIPWVGYLYDFQHRYFPQLFTIRDLRWRDAGFAKMLENAPCVIANAASVKADAERFFSPFGARIFVLPFSAAVDPRWLDTSPEDARLRYGVASRYFIVSNQFWVHKRHDVAIEAFARIARRHSDIQLICTGATDDARAPDHFAMLQAMTASAGIADRVRFLGLIPKQDQIALLRGAIAVVQPTTFEGGPGGGSVFDAVALGVRAIVSDIPVNREIEREINAFFAPNDPDDLARAMEAAVASSPRPIDQATLLREGDERRTAMGRVLACAVRYAIAARHGG